MPERGPAIAAAVCLISSTDPGMTGLVVAGIPVPGACGLVPAWLPCWKLPALGSCVAPCVLRILLAMFSPYPFHLLTHHHVHENLLILPSNLHPRFDMASISFPLWTVVGLMACFVFSKSFCHSDQFFEYGLEDLFFVTPLVNQFDQKPLPPNLIFCNFFTILASCTN